MSGRSNAARVGRVRRTSMRAAVMATVVVSIVTACDGGTLGPANPDDLAFARFRFASWEPAKLIQDAWPGAHAEFNTPYLDGCPLPSKDGLRFYMASTRPGGMGGIDIWVSKREKPSDPWGEPENIGAPVNTASDDFCPTIAPDGRTFFFVSKKQVGVQGVDWCGGGDIYVTRINDEGTYAEPKNLGCDLNSAYDEFSPFPVDEPRTGRVLYFSSNRPGLGTGGDVYVAKYKRNRFVEPMMVPGVNSTSDDGHPNVRRDGLEMYFYSNRPDSAAQGGNDIYVATRKSTAEPFGTPVNLGPNVNSPASETRPSLEWNGATLYVGSTRAGGEGSADVYVTRREPVKPRDN